MHYLEEALLKAIIANDYQNAKILIQLIKETNQASLTAFDENGTSLLQTALQQPNLEIFDALYPELKTSTVSMFHRNNKGQSLFSLAIEKNKLTIAKQLYDDHTETNPTNEEIDLFSQIMLDAIPLAIKNPESLKFILDRTKTLSTKIPDIINTQNSDGNNLLHQSVIVGRPIQVSLLIHAGADMFSLNRNNKNVLDLLETQDDLLQQVFVKLDNTKKTVILAYYRQKMLETPADDLKKRYFSLCTLHSLNSLCAAHLEFNSAVPIQTGRNPNKRIPDEILYSSDVIPPLYRGRVLEKERSMGINRSNAFNPLLIQDNTDINSHQIKLLKNAIVDTKTDIATLKATYVQQTVYSFLNFHGILLSIVIGAVIGACLIGLPLALGLLLSGILGPLPLIVLPVIFGSLTSGIILGGILGPLIYVCKNYLNFIEEKSTQYNQIKPTINQLESIYTQLLDLKNKNVISFDFDDLSNLIMTLKQLDNYSTEAFVIPFDTIDKVLTAIEDNFEKASVDMRSILEDAVFTKRGPRFFADSTNRDELSGEELASKPALGA